MTRSASIVFISLLLWGCAGTPANVVPVQDFELERYLGQWHEVARLDHRFERGLEQVTARYSLKEDGTVRVLNRGFSPQDARWQEAEGRAHFAGEPGTGHLKVSFFGPFYGSYVIFELDKAGYQYAFVAGPSTSYLWLLSRSPEVDDVVMQRFLELSGSLGFDVNQLIFPATASTAE